jgi:hypothetical protein
MPNSIRTNLVLRFPAGKRIKGRRVVPLYRVAPLRQSSRLCGGDTLLVIRQVAIQIVDACRMDAAGNASQPRRDVESLLPQARFQIALCPQFPLYPREFSGHQGPRELRNRGAEQPRSRPAI